MLEKAKEAIPNLETREGSLIYTALAPAAMELQNMYIELDYTINQFFSDTQDRESLIRRCRDQGFEPHQATKAVLKGEFNIDIPIGARFSGKSCNYRAIERITERTYEMECEMAGSVGNEYLGPITPIEFINGLSEARLTEIKSEGTDEEETEHLRSRFYTVVRKPSTSGNRYDYYNWAMKCEGVGAAKVFPLENGPGTVKVVITDADKRGASSVLIRKVADYIEELRPIGATVSVVSAVERTISVRAKVKIKNGMNLGMVQNQFASQIEKFLKDYALETTYISLARIGNLLINTQGIEDYTELLLNGTAENVQLSDLETAVIGTVTLEVMG